MIKGVKIFLICFDIVLFIFCLHFFYYLKNIFNYIYFSHWFVTNRNNLRKSNDCRKISISKTKRTYTNEAFTVSDIVSFYPVRHLLQNFVSSYKLNIVVVSPNEQALMEYNKM